ncbi:MAG: DMT family transporter [Eggerthellaceae bacterium]|nr:DMT family transporter [Eggerthellaceae bacterium]
MATSAQGSAGIGRSVFVRGVVTTLLGAGLWGFSGACAQLLLSQYGLTPLFITSVRMICAGALFLVVILVTKRPALWALFKDRKALLQMGVFGSAGLFLCHITYLVTIDYTNAGTATVLQCLGILFVMIYACLRKKRLPSGREAAGLGLALVATFVIATHGNPGSLAMPLPGLVWGLLAGLASAFYIVYPKKLLDRWGSLLVTGVGMFVGGIAACIVVQPWTVVVSLDPGGIGALAVVIVVGTFGAFYLFMQGIKDIGPVRASLLGAIEPVSATFFSWAWLGTVFPPIDFLGFAMMIAMVFFVVKTR